MVRTVASSPWTEEDRVLMLAYAEYKASLCPGCGLPKETAWHSDGSHVVKPVAECDGCSVQRRYEWEEAGSQGDPPKRVTYTRVVDVDDEPAPIVT